METDDREPAADISQTEVRLLIKALTRSVDNYNTRRYYMFAMAFGLIIGGCLSAFFAVYIFKYNGKKQSLREYRMEKHDETIKKLEEIDSKISSLAEHTKSILKKTEHMDTRAVYAQKVNESDQTAKNWSENISPVSKQLQKDNYVKYRVYIHCARKKDNQKVAANLYHFLTKKGYKVGAVQYVKSENNDIRYFHDDDRDAAFALKKDVCGFISRTGNGLNLKVVYLGRVYPETAAGQLELWINPDY